MSSNIVLDFVSQERTVYHLVNSEHCNTGAINISTKEIQQFVAFTAHISSSCMTVRSHKISRITHYAKRNGYKILWDKGLVTVLCCGLEGLPQGGGLNSHSHSHFSPSVMPIRAKHGLLLVSTIKIRFDRDHIHDFNSRKCSTRT